MTARIILHLPERFILGFSNGKTPLLYGAIRDCLRKRGVEVDLVEKFQAKRCRDDGNLHIVENGTRQMAGVLNSATAYLEGFFHVDPIGIQADSRIGARLFDPQTIYAAEAAEYLAALQQRFVARRHSRYRQRKAVADLPKGGLAVFLQGADPMRKGHAYCGYEEMLQAVCQGAEGRPVIVKAHPLQQEMGEALIAEMQARGLDLIQTAANVHDVLASCVASVSINSGASIEGFMHGKPAVLFGKSDFAQLTQTAFAPQGFSAALRAARHSPPDYAKALYWYFGQNCLDIQASSFADRLLAIFAEAGFDADRLGLNQNAQF